MMKFHDEEQQTYFRHDVTRPWQDDHLFVSHNLAENVISCEVLNNEITQQVSDHRPLMAEIHI
jgi:endonuclease/exonuclease/phosphatase family metal-dependent hydrolase